MDISVLPFKQEGFQMYAGIMSASDLIATSKVDEWIDEGDEQQGYQRSPEKLRYRKVARYLQKDPKPLLPGSILLSYRGKLPQRKNDDSSTTVSLPEGECFWIVDGQHRRYGLQEAIEQLDVQRVSGYQIPVVIVEFQNVGEEAHQFQVINETMKKVRTDLARRLLAIRVTSGAVGRRAVQDAGRLWEAKAVEIINVLSNDEDSPWKGRIQKPNERKEPRHTVKELSFSTSLKPILTSYPFDRYDIEVLSRLLKRYWQAWYAIAPEAFDDANDYVIAKTPGVFSLHVLARDVLKLIERRGESAPSVEDIKVILKDLDEYAASIYWRADNSEGAAMAGSMKGFKILSDVFVESLEENGHEFSPVID